MTETPNPNAPVSAVILAAGTSARMGRPKQLLPLGGTTVLARAIENVRSAGLVEVVLVLGASAEAIRQQLPPSLLEGLKVVVNQAYAHGMASSLREGLSALDPQSAAALIILGDQPLLRPQTLRQIIAGYHRSGAQIVIPSHQGKRGNPVLLRRSFFSEVMALEGDTGCRAIFGNHLDAILKVEVEDPGILLDIDNQDDYDRLTLSIREQHPPRIDE
ncbi:MAG: nucleotidyltransferase family protein [Acidobacteriaceae bacterium]